MKKTPNQKARPTTQTIRHLQHHDLAQVVGGSISVSGINTTGISISSGTSVISSGTSILRGH